MKTLHCFAAGIQLVYSVKPIVGVPFQNADLIDPDDGDLVTHLQIGQIEIQ